MIGSVPDYVSQSKKTNINKDGGNLQGNIKKPNNSWSKIKPGLKGGDPWAPGSSSGIGAKGPTGEKIPSIPKGPTGEKISWIPKGLTGGKISWIPKGPTGGKIPSIPKGPTGTRLASVRGISYGILLGALVGLIPGAPEKIEEFEWDITRFQKKYFGPEDTSNAYPKEFGKYEYCEQIKRHRHPHPEYQKRLEQMNCPPELCDRIKKSPHLDEEFRKHLVELNCPPESKSEETQPTATSTSTSPEATPEPSRQCYSSDGPILCGGGQTPDELETGRLACGSCGFGWDEEGGRCTNKQGDVIWPRHPLANNTVRPECPDGTEWTDLCGGRQTQGELGKGYAVCSACGFEWEMEAGGCKNEQGKRIWPQTVKNQKKPFDSPEKVEGIPKITDDLKATPEGSKATPEGSKATLEPSRQCGPPDRPNLCRGGQTLDEFYTGFKVCEICGFTWDKEAGKCTTKEGYVKWPQYPLAEAERPQCTEGLRCGGGQTQAELGKGYDICNACGFKWEIAVGGCRNEQGERIWPPDQARGGHHG